MEKIQENQMQKHAEQISQKLTDLTHKSRRYKFVIADKDEKPILKLPLLLAIVLLIIMPIAFGLFLATILFTGYHIFVHKHQDS